jgi:hypothetical protein
VTLLGIEPTTSTSNITIMLCLVQFLKCVELKYQKYFEGNGPTKQLHKVPAFGFFIFVAPLWQT